jgi:hypothetical protein
VVLDPDLGEKSSFISGTLRDNVRFCKILQDFAIDHDLSAFCALAREASTSFYKSVNLPTNVWCIPAHKADIASYFPKDTARRKKPARYVGKSC